MTAMRERFWFIGRMVEFKILMIIVTREMTRPVGRENFLMLLTNWFLMRSVFGSRARTKPGMPIQRTFKSDMEIGINGYLSGRRMKMMARMAA